MKKYYIVEQDGDILRSSGNFEASSPHDALLQKVASRHATYGGFKLNRFFGAISESLHSKLFDPKFKVSSLILLSEHMVPARKKPSQTNKTYHIFRLHGTIFENLNKKYVAVTERDAIVKLSKKNPGIFDEIKRGALVAITDDVYKQYKAIKFTKGSDLKKEADDKYEDMYYA